MFLIVRLLNRFWLLPGVFTLLLVGCSSNGGPHSSSDSLAESHAEQLYQQGEFNRAAQEFLALADRSNQRAHFRLRAAEAFHEEGDLENAARALDSVKRRRLSEEEIIRADLIEAELALVHHDAARASHLLMFPDIQLPQGIQIRVLELRARSQAELGDFINSARTRIVLNSLLNGADRTQNETQVIDTLGKLTSSALKTQVTALPANDVLQPWLIKALRKTGQTLPQNLPQPNRPVGTQSLEQHIQHEGFRAIRSVALLLPNEGSPKTAAQSVRDGFFVAYFADHNETRPSIRIYDSGNTPEDALGAYQQAVHDGVDRIVGPLTREAVGAIFAQGKLPVPVLALNYPEGNEMPPRGSAEFGLLPDEEAAQVAEHMLDRNIVHSIIITATDDWAERAALAFRAQFEQRDGTVVGEARLKEGEVNFSTIVRQALNTLPAMKNAPGSANDNTVTDPPSNIGIFLSMRPQQARLLLPQLKLAGYGYIPVFATSHIYAATANSSLDRDLNSVQFCDAPWLFNAVPGLAKYSELSRQLTTARGNGARLFALGMDAYALLPYLDWMTQHPDVYLPGATGQLTKDGQGRIHRLLTWAQFENGIAHPSKGELTIGPAP